MATAVLSPSCASEITSLTPRKPRRVSMGRNAVQKVSASEAPIRPCERLGRAWVRGDGALLTFLLTVSAYDFTRGLGFYLGPGLACRAAPGSPPPGVAPFAALRDHLWWVAWHLCSSMPIHLEAIRAGTGRGSMAKRSCDRTKGVVLRGTESLLTHCWRGVDSNFRFRDVFSHTSGRRIGTQVGGFWTRRQNRFATDSPLEGNGFELSVRGHGKSRCRLFVPLDCLGRVGAPERGDGDCRHRSRILARRQSASSAPERRCQQCRDRSDARL